MRVFFVLVIILSVLLLSSFSQEQDTPSTDLSELKARFQTILNEIGSDDEYDSSSAANLLGKVDHLQRSSDISQNISLDWFLRSRESASAPWMGSPLRVVLVVSSFEGMYLNSGIGTFYAALCDFLVHQGHIVTILYTRADNSSEKQTFQKWKTSFEKRGVKVVRLEASRVKVTMSLLSQKSYQVYRYLKDHQEDFDVVHFPEWEGPGYYTTLAKHEGLAFLEKILIVGIHGPWRWVKSGNYKGEKGLLSSAEDFETDWLERKSVELADVVWTPSLDLVQWLSAQGWAFPSYERQSLYMMPFLPGREIAKDFAKMKNSNDVAPSLPATVTELVFFGRLEKRKGLELFADALDKLTLRRPEFQEDLKITFLGRSANIGSQSAKSYLEQRAGMGMWPFRVTYINHKDRKGALEYLRADQGRVAVLPSVIDNSPYTAYECLFLGIPFVATNIPSISALVHRDDKARVLSNVDAQSLSVKLEYVLDNGATAVRPSFNVENVPDSWKGFYDVVSTKLTAAKATPLADDFQPQISICITHYNRPELLKMTIESVIAQTYKNFEVVLVDDGSTSAQAIAYVDSLKPSFEARGWRIVKTRNQYLGAARNTASKLAKGEYLLFLDDDNLAKPDQVATYVKVAGTTGADVLTAVHDVFRGNGLPQENNIASRSVPIGSSAPLGIFKNCFGDANFFIRKSTFMQVGGFTEETDVGQEDYEFLAKAVLEGHKLLPIPEVLLYYRMHNKSEQMIYTTDPIKNDLRAKRPYDSVSEVDNLDLLKILAYENQRYSRNSRNADATCNVTVHSVNPDRIPTLTATSLHFSVSNFDCALFEILIGTYQCTEIQATLNSNEISCTSPSIAVPDNYKITFHYKNDPETGVDTGLTLEVYSVSSPADVSKSVLGLTMKTDPNTFSEPVLINDLANAAGENPNVFSIASDSVQGGSKRAETQIRNLRLVITSTDPSDPAASIGNRLVLILTYNPSILSNVGELVNISQMANCDNTGSCECTADHTGSGCDELSSCPNNCSSHGECVSGQYGLECSCDDGFTGQDCSSTSCSASCSMHGTCVITQDSTNCVCQQGWTGTDCMDPVPCKDNCTGHGICNAGSCVCESAWTGTTCNITSSGSPSFDQASNSPSVKSDDKGTIAFGVIVAVIGFFLIVVGGVAIYFYYKRHKHETQYL